jgi:glycosyltransferase involved in cell wall biosynthesis
MNYQNGLSIVIPTYNRQKQLFNQLKCIFKNDISKLNEIIILDNCSQYDIWDTIKQFENNKIRVIKNPFNIKVHSNIANAFYYCKSQWLWLLSDDDEIVEDAINKIWFEIDRCSNKTGMIKFARVASPQKDNIVYNLKDFINYYYPEKDKKRGDVVFISTNVYNLKNLGEYQGYAFEFSYTYIPHLIPIFKGLDDENISVTFSSKQIVEYIPPRDDGWSMYTVGKGLSTLTHLPLKLTDKFWRMFLDITMSITYKSLIVNFLKDEKKEKIIDLKIIYNNIYRYYLPLPSKIFIQFFMSSKTIRKIAIKIYRVYKKIK